MYDRTNLNQAKAELVSKSANQIFMEFRKIPQFFAFIGVMQKFLSSISKVAQLVARWLAVSKIQVQTLSKANW